MLRINISEMKSRFSAALATAEGGETVIICRRNKPVAELKAIVPEKKIGRKRPVGLARERYPNFKLTDDFNDPLPDDILAYFTGEAE